MRLEDTEKLAEAFTDEMEAVIKYLALKYKLETNEVAIGVFGYFCANFYMSSPELFEKLTSSVKPALAQVKRDQEEKEKVKTARGD